MQSTTGPACGYEIPLLSLIREHRALGTLCERPVSSFRNQIAVTCCMQATMLIGLVPWPFRWSVSDWATPNLGHRE
jgi:hypothetical protein